MQAPFSIAEKIATIQNSFGAISFSAVEIVMTKDYSMAVRMPSAVKRQTAHVTVARGSFGRRHSKASQRTINKAAQLQPSATAIYVELSQYLEVLHRLEHNIDVNLAVFSLATHRFGVTIDDVVRRKDAAQRVDDQQRMRIGEKSKPDVT